MDKEKDSPVLYQEDTQTPTNLETTAQAPVTKGEDNVILDQYQDQNKQNQYATKPNTTTDTKNSSTGSGLDAAMGTEYSWDTKAKERADLDYESAVLESKANYLTNRQELETKGLQGQEQLDMQKYSTNQSNEKAGWTGGYVLDTERQMAYLKQTIQSQMYGSMELQKYGYDTSLVAARLAYDTNKYDLALEYYNTALSRAVSEAEITGYYVSPETSEMLNEYSIASRILNDDTATTEDKQRADKVLASVYEWFEANGISKQGVETYSHLVEERTHKMSLDKLYEYQNDAQNQISTDTFVKLDENGNKIYGETGMETINFSKMDGTALKEYITNPDGTINEQKRDQYYSRLDSLSYEMENNFATWCKNQGYTDAEGNTNIDDFKEAFAEYIASTDLADKLAKELNRLGSDDVEFVTQLIDNWDCDLKLPDGSEFTIKMTRSGTGTGAGTSTVTNPDGSTTTTTSTVNSNLTEITLPDGSKIEAAYMKPQKSWENVVKLLSTDNYNDIYTKFTTQDFGDYKSIDNLLTTIIGTTTTAATGATLFGAACAIPGAWAGISAAAGAAGAATGVGAAVAIGVDTIVTWIKDGITSDDWERKREALEIVEDGLLNSIGKDNINLLKTAYDEWNNMDQYTKNGLSASKRKMYEDAHKFYKNYSTVIEAIEYCSHYDSNIIDSDLFEYTGDVFERVGDRWDDGYQFGDVTGTVVDVGKGIVSGVAEVGLAIVGKGWLW